MDIKNKDVEQLENDLVNIEDAKITLPEIIFFMLLAVSADILEIIADLALATGIGLVLWIIAFVYGLFVGAITFLWSAMRTKGSFVVGQIVKRKLAPILIGYMLGEVVPVRTITLAIVIILNNKFTEKHRNEILNLLKLNFRGAIQDVA